MKRSTYAIAVLFLALCTASAHATGVEDPDPWDVIAACAYATRM